VWTGRINLFLEPRGFSFITFLAGRDMEEAPPGHGHPAGGEKKGIVYVL